MIPYRIQFRKCDHAWIDWCLHWFIISFTYASVLSWLPALDQDSFCLLTLLCDKLSRHKMCQRTSITYCFLGLLALVCVSQADLRIGAFNIKTFGRTKYGKENIMNYIVEVSCIILDKSQHLSGYKYKVIVYKLLWIWAAHGKNGIR